MWTLHLFLFHLNWIFSYFCIIILLSCLLITNKWEEVKISLFILFLIEVYMLMSKSDHMWEEIQEEIITKQRGVRTKRSNQIKPKNPKDFKCSAKIWNWKFKSMFLSIHPSKLVQTFQDCLYIWTWITWIFSIFCGNLNFRAAELPGLSGDARRKQQDRVNELVAIANR